MTPELKQKLNLIVDKTFNYKGKNITIEKYKVLDNGMNVVIFADGRPMNFLINEINIFLEELYNPVVKEEKKLQVSVPEKGLITFEPTKENATIKATLMDILQKVKEDPTYIPQANSICDVVSQMVAIQKNEIQIINIANKFR
jgi:hypothetical protein